MKEPRKRERRSQPRLTITQILSQMQSQADIHHYGDLAGNVLKIFNTLGTEEKRTFLRQGLELLWAKQIDLARAGIEEVMVDIGDAKLMVDPVYVQHEREEIDNVNHEETMKMKTFLLKFALVTGTLGMFLVIGVTWFYGTFDRKTTTEAIGHFTKILEIFFK